MDMKEGVDMENEYDDLSLVILSCDTHSYLWDGYFKLLNKYWKQHPSEIILSTESRDYQNESVTLSHNINCKEEWSDRTYRAIRKASTEYVFVTLDDFYLKAPVDNERLHKYLQCMRDDRNIVEVSLASQPRPNYHDHYNTFGLLRRSRVSAYRVSAQPTIWRNDYLMRVLRAGENPWQFELSASFRSVFLRGKIYCVDKWHEKVFPTDGGWLVVRGVINENLQQYFSLNEGIVIMNDEINHQLISTQKSKPKIVRIWGYAVHAIQSLFKRQFRDEEQ